MSVFEKPSDMERGAVQFVERWSNKRAAQLGYQTAQGRTAKLIAETLGDGISSATVRGMQREWDLERLPGYQVVAELDKRDDLLMFYYRSGQAGLDPEEALRRMILAANQRCIADIIGDKK